MKDRNIQTNNHDANPSFSHPCAQFHSSTQPIQLLPSDINIEHLCFINYLRSMYHCVFLSVMCSFTTNEVHLGHIDKKRCTLVDSDLPKQKRKIPIFHIAREAGKQISGIQSSIQSSNHHHLYLPSPLFH
eukprot:TRINITY_DN1828_c0_g1_i7.p1 TRINITY_DN1828_c0_g1~~TRINITY_DN1828_c0_g1_i7.p1  ORF type:complete len:130 (+),score=8.51 TRINITY_DN1828_c0_g1_i7:118-507(+)